MMRAMTTSTKYSTLFFAALIAGGCANGTGDPDTSVGSDSGVDTSTMTDTNMPSTCGNGAIDDGEECDGANLGGETCVGLGYSGGDLACLLDCSFNKAVCEDVPCGNGMIDGAEECDGGNLGVATCETQGFTGGTLGCSATCTFNTDSCTACGNGSVDAGEECDGSDLNGIDCEMRGFTGGVLACDSTCGFDDSACTDATCGDGTRAGSEDCDMADLGGQDCMGLGFFDGALACETDCTFDTSPCHNCGNGTIEGSEECDGSEFGSASCMSLGFTMGALACGTDCTIDTSGCSSAVCGNGMIDSGEECDDANITDDDGCTSCAVDAGWACASAPSMCDPICGNSMIHGGEECDTANLDGEDCMSRGFDGGTLGCSGTCRFDESACTSTTCGNGVLDTGEECDDGGTDNFDGCDSTCQVDANYDLPVRLTDGDGSNHGRLEVRYEGVWREVCDDTYVTAQQQAMADIVCGQLGYTGSGHQWIERFGGGGGSPVMDDVQCTGSETSLAQCPFAGWEREDCSGVEAVGIRCMPGEGDIRLVDGPHGMEGRLQIYQGGAWGEVCDDYFDGNYMDYLGYSTDTVCQQMGYWGGIFLSTYDAPSGTFVLDDVNCTGTERRIADCPHRPFGMENCSAIEGAGFRCLPYIDDDVRLVDGASRNNGRIEILHNTVWGTICDDGILFGSGSDNFSAVACDQLGYSGGDVDFTTAAGTDPIWLDDLMCVGTELSVADCPARPWGENNCSHTEDVVMTCTP